MEKRKGVGIGVLVIGALAALYFLFTRKPDPVTKTIVEYQKEKSATAEVAGVEGAKHFCEAQFGSNELMRQRCIEAEHGKMLLEIAHSDYTGCVKAYKRCHYIPENGDWEKEPYDFCSGAISEKNKSHPDPVVQEIIDEGMKVLTTAESARARKIEGRRVHPGAYKWIKAHTGCINVDSAHYWDYEIGWQDARVNGYAEDHPRFYDKVMQFAGMKKGFLGMGDWGW